eukprot:CAMPEP_0198229480 /NCGR_PEP_ID=MMETSP1445-20131203/114148_1 /TAXON_ID=36898 /ORGANISM="Pyramimonas sp., Strain CCMP2087" /LENGTH=441 /DNA_ID=CAMNT_0043909943 /DNA_START=295 /DNA_END=1620 /DNA_ORIENTATION=+
MMWRRHDSSWRAVAALRRTFSSDATEAISEKSKKKREVKIHPLTPPPPPSDFPAWEPRDFFRYEVLHQSKRSAARVGRIHTPHGIVDTPNFVAVGTNGTLKAVDHRQADDAGLQLMFCNTYHLLLQPGPDTIAAAGGLHKYVNRTKPIITDSGGFQVFSLSHGSVHDELNMKARKSKTGSGTGEWQGTLIKVNEEGATFRSYIDGARILLTPESSVDAQKAYKSDIIIPLDELPPYHITPELLEKSVYLSHRWMARSLKRHLANINEQAMYAVVHGGIDRPMRQLSIDYLTQLPFDGYCIGGSLGKDRQELVELLKFVMPQLPANKPNHLLGIADVPSIEECVPLGVDTFDSCFPTRLGRHNTLLTRNGRVNIKKRIYARDFRPVDEECECHVCKNHTLAYLHHLCRANEPMGAQLNTLHNLHYMCDFMADQRQKILNDEI